jgi:hypothetical protein
MQICGEGLQYSFQDARAHPLLKSPVAGLVRWEAIRQISPSGTRAQHPKDPTEDGAAILPRATTTVSATRWLRDKRIENSPLGIGKVTRMATQHVEHLLG